MQRFNSIVKVQIGCIDCPAGNQKPIYALDRCPFHYRIFNNKARQDRVREKNPERILQHQTQWNWYEDKIRQLKFRCENCGDRIIQDKKYDHWIVCHVLSKAIFKSIATHDDNWWEGCNTCHTLYDNFLDQKDERLMHMRIYPVIIEKIKILKPFVSEHRRFNGLPLFILDKI